MKWAGAAISALTGVFNPCAWPLGAGNSERVQLRASQRDADLRLTLASVSYSSSFLLHNPAVIVLSLIISRSDVFQFSGILRGILSQMTFARTWPARRRDFRGPRDNSSLTRTGPSPRRRELLSVLEDDLTILEASRMAYAEVSRGLLTIDQVSLSFPLAPVIWCLPTQ